MPAPGGGSRGTGREGRGEEEKAAGPREGRRQEARGRRGDAEQDGRDGYGGKKKQGTGGEGDPKGVRAGPGPTWHRHTTSDSVANRSTTLPLPSSPHCAPSTTVTLLPPGSLRARLSPPPPGWLVRSLDARVPDMVAGGAAAAAASSSLCLAPPPAPSTAPAAAGL